MNKATTTFNCRGLLLTLTLAFLVLAPAASASFDWGRRVSLSGSSHAAAAPPVVGEWQRVNRCRAFVRAFKKAGLKQLIPEWLVGGGYRSGSIKRIAKDPHPCRGAKAFKHSHAFYADGKFASFTARGRQVDNGTYKIIDSHTFRLRGGAAGFKVRYTVSGDTIRFRRVIAPSGCKSKRCREDHAHLIAAFFPGSSHRIPFHSGYGGQEP